MSLTFQMYQDEVKAEGIDPSDEQLHPRVDSGKEINVLPSPRVPITSSG